MRLGGGSGGGAWVEEGALSAGAESEKKRRGRRSEVLS